MKSSVDKTSNKYSNNKIVWFPDKLNAMRDGVVSSPLYVRIKPINACCHDCYFCVYNSKYSSMHNNMKKVDMLSKDKLLEIVSDFKKMDVKAVTFSGGGEPLMHPNIVEVMNSVKNNNIDLSIITNGQLLSDDRAVALANAKWVRISMDYWNREGFKNSRSKNDKLFDNIVDNINNFAEIKEYNCDLSVNYIITKSNYNTIYEAARFLKDLKVDNVRFSPVWIPDFINYHTPLIETVQRDIVHAREKLQSDSYRIYDSYNIVPDVKERKYNKCYVLQYNPVIGADGLVYNCHNKSYESDAIIGSIKNQSFYDMWQSVETKKHFDGFNPQKHCKCQCANDKKNIFLHDVMNCYGDNYV